MTNLCRLSRGGFGILLSIAIGGIFGPADSNAEVSDVDGKDINGVAGYRRHVYNVRDWNAIPDDGVNDQVAIQNAINYVGGTVGGGTLLFPKGWYRVESTLNVNSSAVRLEGVGLGNITAIVVPNHTFDILIVGPYAQAFQMENISGCN